MVVALAPSSGAFAEDQSEAQRLFEQGRKALDRGDEATACTKFEESLRLARSAGPLFNLAMCEEHKGHLVEAARNWREALSFVPPEDDRVEPAWTRLRSLDAKLGRITIALPVDTPTGATLLLDGIEMPQRAAKEGSAGAREPGLVIEVAPGDHGIELDARGKDKVHVQVTVGVGENKDVALAWAKAPPGPKDPEPPHPNDPPEAPTVDPGKGVRIGGIVLGVAGIATTIVGSATGILTILKRDEVDANCVPNCNDVSRTAATDGKTFSIVSSITFPTGLAMTAAGAIMIFTHLPRSGEKPADPGPKVTAVVPAASDRFVGWVVAGTL